MQESQQSEGEGEEVAGAGTTPAVAPLAEVVTPAENPVDQRQQAAPVVARVGKGNSNDRSRQLTMDDMDSVSISLLSAFCHECESCIGLKGYYVADPALTCLSNGPTLPLGCMHDVHVL